MKPFNLEEAKAGKPLVDKLGSKIKFIAFEPLLLKPVICMIRYNLYQFNADGQYFENVASNRDLLMAPTKHEGWINMYACIPSSKLYAGCMSQPYKTEAIANEYAGPDRIACIRIEWEE